MANEEKRIWDDEVDENYDAKNRKTGAARFFELLGRDFTTFYTSSFIVLLGVLPGLALLYFSVMAGSLLGCLLGGMFGGALGGPCLCGLFDTVLRSLREEPGFWWVRYKKAWKQNWKQACVFGIVIGLFIGGWALVIFRLPDMENVPTAVWITIVLGMLFAMILLHYIFAQIVLIAANGPTLLKNSAFFLMGYFPRSLVAGIVVCAYWALTFLYMPYTVVLVLITGAWFPTVIALMLIYPIMNRALHIEEVLDQRAEEMYRDF